MSDFAREQLREWPGVAVNARGPHGTPTDDLGFLICESCGSEHHPNNRSCNAFRNPTDERCVGTLGEVFRCGRPRGHLGRHEVHDHGLMVSWEPLQ